MPDDPDLYLIWSHEQGAWWAADANGYTRQLSGAGRYTERAAMSVCINAIQGAVVTQRLPTIIRGHMTGAETAEIERLAATLKNPKPGPIARRLNRHPATIKWYMLRHGLLTQAPRTIPRPYTTRSGITRYPWSPEQDRRLDELLREGNNYRQAGATLTAEFGVPRGSHNCQVRAVMLAASDDQPGVADG